MSEKMSSDEDRYDVDDLEIIKTIGESLLLPDPFRKKKNSFIYPTWRKFRIEIHFEPIRNFPNHSGICIRTKQFHSDLIRS